jgi:hypothetical protein
MQIQMLLIYDPSTARGYKVTFTGILAELDARRSRERISLVRRAIRMAIIS